MAPVDARRIGHVLVHVHVDRTWNMPLLEHRSAGIRCAELPARVDETNVSSERVQLIQRHDQSSHHVGS
jgi:hypothetical protein